MDNQLIERQITNAIADLLGNQEARTISEARARTILTTLAQHVREYAEDLVLLSLLTADDMAELLGVTARRIRAKARAMNARGVSVGWQVPGTSQWLFRPGEVELLRPMAVGRPRTAASAAHAAMDEGKGKEIRVITSNFRAAYDQSRAAQAAGGPCPICGWKNGDGVRVCFCFYNNEIGAVSHQNSERLCRGERDG